MKDNEKKLSEYIDHLNADQKPDTNGFSAETEELQELYQTVRLVRSIKEPTMPADNYHIQLANTVKKHTTQKKTTRTRKWKWLTSIAGIAAIFLLIVNFIFPVNNSNIVSAMETAYQELTAYHGTIEIIQTNAQGDTKTQAKLEVWATKEGHYFVKGLSGETKEVITVNNGEKKWQIQPNQKQVQILPTFPDTYHFAFELGEELTNVTTAVNTKVIGEESINGRDTTLIEVTPQGGSPYQLWVDKETKLPLQKQSAMQNAIQYTMTYTDFETIDNVPEELFVYNLPNGYDEVTENPEQIVDESTYAIEAVVGFTPIKPETVPKDFRKEKVALIPNQKLTKIYYYSPEKKKTVLLMQKQNSGEIQPAANAIIGKVNGHIAEIQSPIQKDIGIIGGAGPYNGLTDIHSIRWQQEGMEFALIGDAPIEVLSQFTNSLTNNGLELPSLDDGDTFQPDVEVPFDLTVEQNEQQKVDGGGSPWRLDPLSVAHVFVNLQVSPEGISGDYPIDINKLRILQNNGEKAMIQVSDEKTAIHTIYVERIVRQDTTGIWTVTGYDKGD